MLLREKKVIDDPERVMYPRRQRPQPLRRSPLVGGTPITEEIAIALRRIVFGHSNAPTRSEWLRTAFVFREPDSDLAYGLRMPRNGTRSLLAAVQAHIIKHLLFPPPPPRPQPRAPGEALRSLRPSSEKQQEALWQSLTDIIWRAGERELGMVCAVPQGATTCSTTSSSSSTTNSSGGGVVEECQVYVPQSSSYFQDGVTEKIKIFKFTSREDLEIFLKCYAYIYQEDPGPGALLLLYSTILSRGIDNIRSDLGEDRFCLLSSVSLTATTTSAALANLNASKTLESKTLPSSLSPLPLSAILPTSTDASSEEGPECVVTLALTGRSTPHLHNGVIYVGDENTYARPRYGIPFRSEVGFLVWRGDADDAASAAMSSSTMSSSMCSMAPPEDGRHPGSRLKTPSLPVWVTLCGGHYGVIFNTNRELLRDYHAERSIETPYFRSLVPPLNYKNRFDLIYYSGGPTGSHAVLGVDTRFSSGGGNIGGIGSMQLVDSMHMIGSNNSGRSHSISDATGAPPLERLIHTKWRDAQITWNGTVPHI